MKSWASYLLIVLFAVTTFGSFANADSGDFNVLRAKKYIANKRTRKLYFKVDADKIGSDFTVSIRNGKKLKLKDCSVYKGFWSWLKSSCERRNRSRERWNSYSRVRGGTISLNGQVIVDNNDLDQTVENLSLSSELLESNTLEVKLNGPFLSYIVLKIDGEAANLQPVADFDTNDNESDFFVGEEVSFDASASIDSDGSIVEYLWDFGDGESASTTTPTVSHRYDSNGQHTVTLSVVDNDGSESLPVELNLNTIEPDELEVGFEVSGELSNDRLEIVATDTTIPQEGVSIINRQWTLKNNTGETIDSAASLEFFHSFPAPESGIFNLELTVTDNLGRVESTTQPITVFFPQS